MAEVALGGVLERFRRGLTAKGRRRAGRFVVEGIRGVERALRAGLLPTELVVCERYRQEPESRVGLAVKAAEVRGSRVNFLPEPLVLELAEGRTGSEVLGLVPLPVSFDLVELRSRAVTGSRAIVVLCDVEEPGNVGAILRTAHASGAVGAICIGVSDPYHPKAVRTSMGSLFRLPIAWSATTDEVLASLVGLPKVGAVARGGVLPWELPGPPLALFLGSEAEGLPDELVKRLEHNTTIPMPDHVDSYSVNAAAAALLYEVQVRRAYDPSSRS